ncbi:ATP-dependent DNA helicase DinG [Bacillus sp. FJAT-18017]|uniref:ATP-dependent DNA helicase DinG n=1 Tax=Bacillus sp. FJAT-18017 TaxID=1705566 RepID=UPI0006AFAA3A|nr:ATP-dependent DNA helicase DinG [Bacillus sp. FJAT-18017]ALC90141.1 ATP-dependent DNA helicase DinG [Bacillus sp. FJAT-18017]
MHKKFVVVDLETTGNSPKKGDRIIQFAAVVIEEGKITNQFTSLLNPGKQIPIFIEELTGLKNEDVKDAPLFSEVAPEISSILEDAYFVAHNVLFDLGFLQEELLMAGEEGFLGPVIDTVEMARFLEPEADSYKLSDLAEKEGLEHDRPHQADSDALVTAELFLLFLSKMESLPKNTLEQLSALSQGLKSDIHLLLEEYSSRAVSAPVSDTGKLVTINGISLKRKNEFPTKEFTNDDTSYPFKDEDKKTMMLRSFVEYEERTGQFEMMDEVYHALTNHTHALIEAGTGIGKSIGYLLPAAFFSRQRGARVVISTYTIQLQEQLMKKDIPLLKETLPFPVKATLMKGMNNYLSLPAFAKSLEEENDNYDTALAKMQILVWLTRTESGDRDELNLSSGGALYWNSISEEGNNPIGKEAWQGYHFYDYALKLANQADLIITNHSLLLSDVDAGSTVLPPYDYAVLDEGHQFEHASSDHMGIRLDYIGARLTLGQFGLYEQKQLFYKVEKVISSLSDRGKAAPRVKLNQLISDTLYEMDDFFNLLISFVTKTVKNHASKRLRVRIDEKTNHREWEVLKNAANRFSFLLKDLHGAAASMLDMIIPIGSTDTAVLADQLHGFMEDAVKLRDKLNVIFLDNTKYVKWIETDTRSPHNATSIYSMPLSVASEVKARFFDKKKSVILTSASLTVDQSFSFILSNLGLDSHHVNTVSIPSPFNYERNVQMFISTDLPAVNTVPQDEYIAEIAGRIISICDAAKGRMLILFTSHEMLKKTYELVKESGLLEEFALIAQGISGGSRSRLTRNFLKFDKAVLFGTNSFWEGVDIPGEGLSCLVVVRLPFSPPDEPWTKAKCEMIEQRGGKPFSEYSLPEAVLRFKQGFGRLIRTGRDRGVIVVFDKRLGEAAYGKAFLRSIPKVPVHKVGIDELIEGIEKWL